MNVMFYKDIVVNIHSLIRMCLIHITENYKKGCGFLTSRHSLFISSIQIKIYTIPYLKK